MREKDPCRVFVFSVWWQVICFVAVCTIAIFIATRGARSEEPSKPKLSPVEQRLLEITNAERARLGLEPVAVHIEILGSARSHAEWMAARQSMTHSSGSFCENIAMGQEGPDDAMEAWMNSSGHRANLLRASAKFVGIAAAKSASGVLFWCWQASDGDGTGKNASEGGGNWTGRRHRRR